MKIAIGSDHGGYKLKKKLLKFLETKGYELADMGTHSEESCDYPIIGYKVASSISSGQFERGVLVCKTGIGMSIVANKIHGVRAALCQTKDSARLSREHNDANIIVFGSKFVKLKMVEEMLDIWLRTNFLGGRHRRRVRQIEKIEREISGGKNE